MSASDDRQAIESVIREFLDEAAQGRLLPRFWTGPVADVLALGTEVGEITPVPLNVRSGSVRTRRLDVEEIEGDSATASLRADCLSVTRLSTGGELRIMRRYDGGVVLRRIDGEWRLVTLRQDGVDMKSSLFDPVQAAAEVDDVEVVVAARYLKRSWLGLVVVRNVGDDVTVLGKVTSEHKVWWLFTDSGIVRRSALVLRPGAKWGIAWFSKSSVFRGRKTIRARVNDQNVSLILRPPRRRVVQRLRALLHPNVLIHGLVLLALFAIPFDPERGVAAFALVLLGAGVFNACSELLSYLSGIRASAQILYGVAGTLEVSVAAYFLRREEVRLLPIITSLAVVSPLIWPKVQNFIVLRRADRAELVRDATVDA